MGIKPKVGEFIHIKTVEMEKDVITIKLKGRTLILLNEKLKQPERVIKEKVMLAG
ncbi:hypothetical protein [Halocella sp. SP3-1]|uniref:hypothetical protein n=1 Tax=Halocella sp. SP3-1 TaxID=2382161 RepID=UPI0013DEFFCB|nr:hypothetical protein [Halocella sp. SP3-1]